MDFYIWYQPGPGQFPWKISNVSVSFPDPDQLGSKDPDPSITMQKTEEKPWFLLFCDFFMNFYLWRMM